MRIPSFVEETLRSKNWSQAMNEKTKALEKNGTWEIVERQGDKNPFGCIWIYIFKDK